MKECGHQFADDIFKWLFQIEKKFLTKILPEFASDGKIT